MAHVKQTDPKHYFSKAKPMAYYVNFRDHEGFAGTVSTSAFWSEDGEQCSFSLGLSENPATLDEMRAIRDAFDLAIKAREDHDAAFQEAT